MARFEIAIEQMAFTIISVEEIAREFIELVDHIHLGVARQTLPHPLTDDSRIATAVGFMGV